MMRASTRVENKEKGKRGLNSKAVSSRQTNRLSEERGQVSKAFEVMMKNKEQGGKWGTLSKNETDQQTKKLKGGEEGKGTKERKEEEEEESR
jgi:hypothetical protein